MQTRRFLSFFMVLGAFFIISGTVNAQSPEVSAPEEACDPIARYFEKVICKEEITPERQHIDAIKQQFEDQGMDSDEAITHRSRERLKEIIWNEAIDRLFGKNAIEPTVQETMDYRNSFSRSLDDSHQENLVSLEKVQGILESGEYEAKDEAKLKLLAQTLKTSIAFYEEKKKQSENMPPEYHQMVIETEEKLATTMIRNWKTNKALYDSYGGRVVLEQGQPVPLDAYKKFLEYIRQEGDLYIMHQDYENLFARLERYEKAGYRIQPADPDGKFDSYFKLPPWKAYTSR